MNKTDEFEEKVLRILEDNKGLNWISEGDSAIFPVKLGFWQHNSSWDEPEGKVESRLQGQFDMAPLRDKEAFNKLKHLFYGQRTTSFIKTTSKVVKINGVKVTETLKHLYIVAWFGWSYVGIRVRIVET